MAIEKISVGLDFGNGHKREVGTLAFYEKNAFDPRGNRQKVIGFEYAEEFLNNPLPISPFYLPVKDGVIEGSAEEAFEGLPSVFHDSLPDGWGRLLLKRLLESNKINPNTLTALDKLSYVGITGMGALTYIPDHSNSEEIDGKEINLRKLAEDVKEVLEGYSEDVLTALLRLNGSSGGARPKAVIGFNPMLGKIIHGAGNLPEDFEPWLLKFPMSEDGKDAGAVEYVYSLMAKEAGLEIPSTFLFRLKDSSHPGFFAVKRFDREKNRRLHLHSAAGLLKMNFRTDLLDYKDLLQLAFHLTSNSLDVEKLYRMAVFNVLAHNRDDHAKNFSFLMDEMGKWRVSPVYDLTFSHGPGGYQSMSVMGQSQSPKEEDLIKLGQHFHLSDMVIKEIIGRTKEALLKWPELAKNYGVHIKRIKEIGDKIPV